MGIVRIGIPEDIVIQLARLNGSSAFVETGTYYGDTTRWASAHFEVVHTIERSQELFDKCSKKLVKISGVTPHVGDSRVVLPKILSSISNRKAVFWLDGHWAGGETAGKDDECPLMDELRCVSTRSEDIILIDDARFFLSAPPRPLHPDQWPTIAHIVGALPSDSFVQVIDDVIFVVPATSTLTECLVNYAQQRAEVLLRTTQPQADNAPITRRFVSRLSKMIRRISRG